MADYIVPRVLVQQEFTQTPVFSDFPLAAFIIGPNYKLVRYAEASERALSSVVHPTDSSKGNDYQSATNVDYAYPSRASNSVVDLDYVKVDLEKAVAQYFPHDDIDAGGLFGNIATRVSATKIITGQKTVWNPAISLTLKTAGGFNRSAPLSNRDVQVGDVVVVAKEDGTSPMTTKVRKISAYAVDGRMNVIELQDNLSATLDAIVADEGLSFKLSLTTNASVPHHRDFANSTTNWDASADTIKVRSAITVNDPLLVADDDTLADLAVSSADVFVTHRDLLVDTSVEIASVTSTSDVAGKLGIVHPDNPLAQGVFDAVLNSSGVPVYYLGVKSDNVAGYTAAMEPAKRNSDVYSFVPLSKDRAIQDVVVGHVNAMSTANTGKWRVAWFSHALVDSKLVYDKKTNGNDWLGSTSGDLKTVVIAGATLVTDGVRATDTLLVNFNTSDEGVVTYDEVEIAEVVSETTLILDTAFDADLVAKKVQIKRYYTTDEQIDNLAAVGSDFNSRRVRSVFPDSAKLGSVTKDGVFVAAMLAGLRSGVVPHQGLTNTQVLGVDTLTKSVVTFSEDQLNRLAGSGYWIVTQNKLGATAFTRHQLTTDSSSLNMSEDSVTTNVDSISYAMKNALAPYIGVYNINPTTLRLVESAVRASLDFRMTNTSTARAGAQILGYKVVKVSQNSIFKDKIDVEVEMAVPYPVNFITVKLTV